MGTPPLTTTTRVSLTVCFKVMTQLMLRHLQTWSPLSGLPPPSLSNSGFFQPPKQTLRRWHCPYSSGARGALDALCCHWIFSVPFINVFLRQTSFSCLSHDSLHSPAQSCSLILFPAIQVKLIVCNLSVRPLGHWENNGCMLATFQS